MWVNVWVFVREWTHVYEWGGWGRERNRERPSVHLRDVKRWVSVRYQSLDLSQNSSHNWLPFSAITLYRLTFQLATLTAVYTRSLSNPSRLCFHILFASQRASKTIIIIIIIIVVVVVYDDKTGSDILSHFPGCREDSQRLAILCNAYQSILVIKPRQYPVIYSTFTRYKIKKQKKKSVRKC